MPEPNSNNMLDPLSLSIPLPHSDPTPSHPSGPPRRLLQPSPDHPDDYILEIDNSSLEQFTVCKKKYSNYAIHSREAQRDQSALLFGGLFHSCEELRLQHGLTPEVISRQREIVQTHFLSHPVAPDDHRTADRMITVLNHYNTFYAEDRWPERVLVWQEHKFLERAFKCELCTIPINAELTHYWHKDLVINSQELKKIHVRNLHILWTGRIDLILQDSHGLWVVDHKTSSMGGREFEEAFRLARQTVGYAWAAQQILRAPILGCQINAVIIRALAKTARATSPREEFNRFTYHYSQDRIDEWFCDIKLILTDLATSLLSGSFPMTGPKSFKSPCVYCDYHTNCQLPRASRLADLASDLYRDVTWNPTTVL